jgi:hypothetical protein
MSSRKSVPEVFGDRPIFRTGGIPVSVEESREVLAFTDAALHSKQSGGSAAPMSRRREDSVAF